MRYLGIDYGEKKIGIAVSDEDGKIAMPYSVIANIGMQKAIDDVKKICREKEVGKIVIGESKNFKGESNLIMREIEKFKKIIEKETELPVFYHPEVYSTMEASRLSAKNVQLDASAAAIVLQSFIDKNNMLK